MQVAQAVRPLPGYAIPHELLGRRGRDWRDGGSGHGGGGRDWPDVFNGHAAPWRRRRLLAPKIAAAAAVTMFTVRRVTAAMMFTMRRRTAAALFPLPRPAAATLASRRGAAPPGHRWGRHANDDYLGLLSHLGARARSFSHKAPEERWCADPVRVYTCTALH